MTLFQQTFQLPLKNKTFSASFYFPFWKTHKWQSHCVSLFVLWKLKCFDERREGCWQLLGSSSPAHRGLSQGKGALVLLKSSSKVGLRLLGASVSPTAAHHVTQYEKFCTSGSTYLPSPHSTKHSPYIHHGNPTLLVCSRILKSSFGISGFCSCKIMLSNKLSPSISHISVGRKLELFHILANA